MAIHVRKSMSVVRVERCDNIDHEIVERCADFAIEISVVVLQ